MRVENIFFPIEFLLISRNQKIKEKVLDILDLLI